MTTVKIIWRKKYKTASVWAYNDYIVTIACDNILHDGPVTNIMYGNKTIMATSNNTEIEEVDE